MVGAGLLGWCVYSVQARSASVQGDPSCDRPLARRGDAGRGFKPRLHVGGDLQLRHPPGGRIPERGETLAARMWA